LGGGKDVQEGHRSKLKGLNQKGLAGKEKESLNG